MDHGSIHREAKPIGRKETLICPAQQFMLLKCAGKGIEQAHHALPKLHPLLLLTMAAYWSSWTATLAIQGISCVLLMEDAFSITLPLAQLKAVPVWGEKPQGRCLVVGGELLRVPVAETQIQAPAGCGHRESALNARGRCWDEPYPCPMASKMPSFWLEKSFIHGLIFYTSAEGGVLLRRVCSIIYLLWLSAVTPVCFLRYSRMFSTEQSIKPKSYPHF